MPKQDAEWGGKREGAGRPSTGRKARSVYVTDKEHEAIKDLIKKMREGEEMTKYRGIVKDDMGNMESRQTRWYSTYKEAHDAAEKLCERTIGERGSVEVEQG
ncbi:MAG TPA: hypothetical protein VFC74_00235 [Oscillospiraceae bacterium]|nr:hypothetical protein [Oscillospiraceae bacterium]